MSTLPASQSAAQPNEPQDDAAFTVHAVPALRPLLASPLCSLRGAERRGQRGAGLFSTRTKTSAPPAIDPPNDCSGYCRRARFNYIPRRACPCQLPPPLGVSNRRAGTPVRAIHFSTRTKSPAQPDRRGVSANVSIRTPASIISQHQCVFTVRLLCGFVGSERSERRVN